MGFKGHVQTLTYIQNVLSLKCLTVYYVILHRRYRLYIYVVIHMTLQDNEQQCLFIYDENKRDFFIVIETLVARFNMKVCIGKTNQGKGFCLYTLKTMLAHLSCNQSTNKTENRFIVVNNIPKYALNKLCVCAFLVEARYNS